MNTITRRRLGLLAALMLGMCPALAAVASKGTGGFKTAYYQGKVVPLAKWLREKDAATAGK